MTKLRILSVACLLGLAVGLNPAQAGTDELIKDCENCHGKGGNGDDLKVPNIAGMSEVYLHDTLVAYKGGDRPGVRYKPKDGEETDMVEIVKKLSEDEISALAAHFAKQQYQPHAQQVDAALAAQGKEAFDAACEKCHSEGGTLADDDAGILAGQGKPYLEQQFKLYRDGKRAMPKKMAKKMEDLDDATSAAIVEFLAGGSK